MPVETIAGRKTGLRYQGAGEPALLLHCSLAHSGAWSGVMAGLQDRLQMVAADLPGHGRTEYDPAQEVQAQAVETAIALLERGEGPAHVLGHSFGATVALRVALARPDLVASLALYEPVYFSLLGPEAAAREVEASRPMTAAAEAGDWQAAATIFLQRWGGGMEFSALPDEAQKLVLQVMPILVASDNPIIDPVQGAGVRAQLSRLQQPVLLMQGAASPAVVGEINDVLAAELPRASRKIFDTAGHMGPISHAAQVAEAVRAFLSGDRF